MNHAETIVRREQQLRAAKLDRAVARFENCMLRYYRDNVERDVTRTRRWLRFSLTSRTGSHPVQPIGPPISSHGRRPK